jgi:phosphoglycolate phosphatase
MNDYKLLLFDVDGTLVNVNRAGFYALVKTFYDMFEIKEEIVRQIDFRGKTDPIIYENILELAKRNVLLAKEQYEIISETYLKHLRIEIKKLKENPVIQGVKEFLIEYSKNDKYIIALLTGNIKLGAEIKLSGFGIKEFFKFGVYGSDDKVRNNLVDIAIKRNIEINGNNVLKNNIYIIGDTPLDIECGKVNNVKTVALTTGKYSKSELSKYSPDYVADSLLELIGII